MQCTVCGDAAAEHMAHTYSIAKVNKQLLFSPRVYTLFQILK